MSHLKINQHVVRADRALIISRDDERKVLEGEFGGRESWNRVTGLIVIDTREIVNDGIVRISGSV